MSGCCRRCIFWSFSFRTIFFFQAEDGIRDYKVTGVQTCALPISGRRAGPSVPTRRPARTRPTSSGRRRADRKSTRLNSSHLVISYAVFCLKKKKKTQRGITDDDRKPVTEHDADTADSIKDVAWRC